MLGIVFWGLFGTRVLCSSESELSARLEMIEAKWAERFKRQNELIDQVAKQVLEFRMRAFAQTGPLRRYQTSLAVAKKFELIDKIEAKLAGQPNSPCPAGTYRSPFVGWRGREGQACVRVARDVISDMVRWEGYLGECTVGWDMVESHPSKCNLVVDVGANIGACTLHAALAGYRVIAIEASPTHVDIIKHALALNNLENQVTLIHTAISSESGQTINFTEPDNTAATRQANQGESVMFTTFTSKISDLLKGEECIRLFKIDCEGCESQAIRDLKESNILDDKIDIVKIELNRQFVDEDQARYFLETLASNRTLYHTDSYDLLHPVTSTAQGLKALGRLHTYDLLAFKNT